MPLARAARPDRRLTTPLTHEDKLLLKVRVERLKGNRDSFSQHQPKSRCQHVLQTARRGRRRRNRGGVRLRHVDTVALCGVAPGPSSWSLRGHGRHTPAAPRIDGVTASIELKRVEHRELRRGPAGDIQLFP